MTFTNQRSSTTIGVESQLSASRTSMPVAGWSWRSRTSSATAESVVRGTRPRRSRRNAMYVGGGRGSKRFGTTAGEQESASVDSGPSNEHRVRSRTTPDATAGTAVANLG